MKSHFARGPLRACMAAAAPLLLIGCSGGDISAEKERIRLENDGTVLVVTPSYGGRVTGFFLEDHDNIIWFDEEVAEGNPTPAVSLSAPDLRVYGHSTWIGPQSDWWNRQDVAPARIGEMWPPDPYLVIARTDVADSGGDSLVLQGPESPVSGVAMTQRYGLKDGALTLEAEIRNIRDKAQSWDIWFNTRVKGEALIFVPVDDAGAVRSSDLGAVDGPFERPVWSVGDGIFTIDQVPPAEGKEGRRGKLMVEPDDGWMAAFHDGQAFIILFDLSPAAAIHPDQGQLEFYMSNETGRQGFIEMELHSPYTEIAPGGTNAASERWHVLPYDGPQTREGRADFLRTAIEQIREEQGR